MFPIAYRNYKGVVRVNPERFPDKRVPQTQIILDSHLDDATVLSYVDFVPCFLKKNKDIPVYHNFRYLLGLVLIVPKLVLIIMIKIDDIAGDIYAVGFISL